MKVQKLLKLLTQPNTLSSSDIPDLESLIKNYPYFYLAHALLAKVVYTQERDVEKHAVQRAATYAIDRTHLRMWLENKLVWSGVISAVGSKGMPEQSAAINNTNHLEDIAKQTIKKGTNAISRQQFRVIEHILNKPNLQWGTIESYEVPDALKNKDLSEQCTLVDDRFATETLAHIMVQQKKFKRAIEIYRCLIIKNPEKKAYLSSVIDELSHHLQ
ncbi:hypothetical protein [Candidatus Cardinium hertigii]|uniref:Tetratricopeptide repeat protein n=1 Tax=Candidatus Cardinium hertigii TaxID=247481 RepID=A0A2Z3LAD5_9BACT|nr:hypothetical protein [Candidatus Cardinium hertigii]AWN82289.1 hypothetical protein DK880_00992 [Candidatus Cardinium hertigii]